MGVSLRQFESRKVYAKPASPTTESGGGVAGQFDHAGRDKHDFFSIHAGGLEHNQRPRKAF